MPQAQQLARRLSRLLPFVLLGVGLLLWGDLYVRTIGPTLADGHFPTSTYWVAPKLVVDGRSAELYDTVAFAAAAVEFGAYPDRGFIPNAPMGVLPLLPLGLLPEPVAFVVWTALSSACLVLAIALLLRSLGPNTTVLFAVLAFLPLFQPLRHNFSFGQAFTFVLLALVGGAVARGGRWRDSIAAGCSFGMAGILKLYYGLALLAPSVVQRRWRTVAAAGITLAVPFALSVIVVGADGWQVWLETTLGWRSRPETVVTAYQTLTSLFGHLFRYEPAWNESPVLVAPVLADALYWITVAALVVISVVAIVRPPVARSAASAARLLLPVALVVPVALVASPIAEDYHYVLALFPLLVGGAVLLSERPRSWISWLLFGSAIVLLAPAWPFNQQPVEDWWAILHYPRVYGAMLLWIALLTLLPFRRS